ncbi:MAG: hypothetical protein LBI18_08210, partial [Planctomycetaceae bacterium]|nr:hypothetical protein [Planctomycetaceae bacterium]
MTINQGRRNWLKYFLLGGLICTPVLTFWGKKYFLKNKKRETIDSTRHGIYFPTPQITSTQYTQRACLSPDGKRIAISGTVQYNGIRLFTANAEKLFTNIDTQYDCRIKSSNIGNILALSMSEQPDYSIAYVHREISKNPLDVASFDTLEEYVKYVDEQKFSDRLYCLRSKEEKPFLLYEAKTSIDLNFCFDHLTNYQLCWINQATIVFYNENDILSITTNGNVKKIYSVALNGKKIVSNMFYDTKLN